MKGKRRGENNAKILGWPKSSYRFFYKRLQKNLDELFAQPNRLFNTY